MPIYDVRAPDGNIYSVQAPEGTPEEQIFAFVQQQISQQPEQQGYWGAFGESAKTLLGAPTQVAHGLADKNATREAALAKQDALRGDKARTSFEDISGPGEAFDWFRQMAGGSMGYFAAPAVLGGLAGKVAQIGLKAPGAGKLVGLGALGAQYLTTNLARQTEEQQKAIDTGKPVRPMEIGQAALAAAGSTYLDVLQFGMFRPLFSKFPILGKLIGEKASTETGQEMLAALRNGSLKILPSKEKIWTGIMGGVTFEIPQEIGQQMLERGQAGLPLAGPEATKEYVEAAAGALVLGGGMGGLNAYIDNARRYATAKGLEGATPTPPGTTPATPGTTPPAAGTDQKPKRRQYDEETWQSLYGATDDMVRGLPAPMKQHALKQYIVEQYKKRGVKDVDDRRAGIIVSQLYRSGVLQRNNKHEYFVPPNAPAVGQTKALRKADYDAMEAQRKATAGQQTAQDAAAMAQQALAGQQTPTGNVSTSPTAPTTPTPSVTPTPTPKPPSALESLARTFIQAATPAEAVRQAITQTGKTGAVGITNALEGSQFAGMSEEQIEAARQELGETGFLQRDASGDWSVNPNAEAQSNVPAGRRGSTGGASLPDDRRNLAGNDVSVPGGVAQTGSAAAPVGSGVDSAAPPAVTPAQGEGRVGPALRDQVRSTLAEELPQGGSALDTIGRVIDRLAPAPAPTEQMGLPLAPEPESGPRVEREEVMESRYYVPKPDLERLIPMTGEQLYGDKSQIAAVSIKEMLQNAFDAVKKVVTTDKNFKGSIKIGYSDDHHSLIVLDNGTGMDSDTLGGAFLAIAGTGKEGDANSSGGFGIAKMLFLYGNENIRVITLKDGVISELNTTGKELQNLMVKEKPVKIDRRTPTDEDLKYFPEGHGTYARITIANEYIDPMTGDIKQIPPLPDYWSSVDVLRRSPLFADVEVKYGKEDQLLSPLQFAMYTVPIGRNFPVDKFRQLSNIKFKWGTMRVYVSERLDYVYGHNVHVLSNGIWQFSAAMNKKLMDMYGERIPFEFYFDIVPKVKAGKPGYPFGMNRQELAPLARMDFAKVFTFVNAMYQHQANIETTKNFGNFSYLEVKNRKIVETEKQKLEPTIPLVDTQFAGFDVNDVVTVEDGAIYVNGKMMPEIDVQALNAKLPDPTSYRVDQSLIDPNRVMLHDNVMVTDSNTGETKSLIEFMREEFGTDRINRFLMDMGESFKDLRDMVVAATGYTDLASTAIGVSVDVEYRGVSVSGAPINAMFINPFLPEAMTDPYEQGFGILGTMLHELAHHKAREHGVPFTQEFQRLTYKLEKYMQMAWGHNDYNDFKQDFVKRVVNDYSDIIWKGVHLYATGKHAGERYTLKPIGNRFAGDEESSAGTPASGGAGATQGNAGTNAARTGRRGAGASRSVNQAARGRGNTGGSGAGTVRLRRIKAPVLRDVTPKEAEDKLVGDMNRPTKPQLRQNVFEFFSSFKGSEWLVRKLQNNRRPLLTLQEMLRATGKLIVTGKGFNNAFDLITLATGRAFNALNKFVRHDMDVLDREVIAFANANGLDAQQALARLHLYGMAFHEPERRHTKYLMNVPLSTSSKHKTKLVGVQGTPMEKVEATPADLRDQMLKQLYDPKMRLTPDIARQYASALEELVSRPGMKTNKLGLSATSLEGIDPSTMSLDEKSGDYNVVGSYTVDAIQRFRDQYEAESPENKAQIQKIFDQVRKLQDATTMMSREANYWSPQVDNISAFYGWKHYITFKGKGQSNVSQGDERFELRSRNMSGGMTEFATEFGGRESDSDNPILQTKIEAIKAAMRYGRIGVSQSIKNLIDQKYIRGVRWKTITFEQRYKGVDPAEIRGENVIYHYRPDGAIEIYRIKDELMRNAIRREYEPPAHVLNLIASVTTFMGHTHTRWNPAFHPYNFVRDALTNAFTFGAEYGIENTGNLLNSVATAVLHNGLVKSAKVSRLYNEGNLGEIEKMAKSDPFVADLLEYLEEGGKVSYIQGLSNKSQIEEMSNDIDARGFARTKETVTKYLDIWGDMFELTSRAATYSAVKSMFLQQGKTEAYAKQQAAVYAKNLANFEQVGEWGRNAGAFMMFFRPAATGAVRAIDAIRPVFENVETKIAELPKRLREDPEAVKKFREEHARRKKTGKAMLMSLGGAGATVYVMALVAGDDDEAGRNKVALDDPSLWTRNARLPLSLIGKEGYLQVPWGFGLGAFAAAGAQIAALGTGRVNFWKDTVPNLATLALDSYVPIPISRINMIENFPAWLADSAMPTPIKPFIQYAMNTDSLGREVYNNRLTKYGDPYTGGRNVPEMWRDAAILLFETTGFQVQPSTMQFWANNYADGLAKIAVNAHGIGLVVAGDAKFDPKTELSLIGSFLGRESNYDAKQFASLERKMKTLNSTLKMVKMDPAQYDKFIKKNPNAEMALWIFNRVANRELREYRELYNAVLSTRIKKPDGKELTVQERKDAAKELTLIQNMLKRDLILAMDQYGITP